MASRRSAKVICREGSFWITPKQFWRLVKQDVLTYLSDRPLCGKYVGRQEEFLITINHAVLDMSCQEHLHSFLGAKKKSKR